MALGPRVGASWGTLARFRIFDIPVSVHASVLFVVVVLGWASGFQAASTMAVWGVVVFVSLMVHELGHALTARSYGATVSIELNGLGGLTRWSSPPEGMTPGRTALVSAAGSASGFLLAGVAWVISEVWGPFGGLAGLGVRVLFYVNIVWGLLNWLPVRPLDGGHLLLAFLARVAPRRGEAIARAVFIVTAGLAVLAAVRYRMLFIGIFAVWALMGEFAGERREPVGIPEFRYDEPDDDRGDDPVPETLADDEPG